MDQIIFNILTLVIVVSVVVTLLSISFSRRPEVYIRSLETTNIHIAEMLMNSPITVSSGVFDVRELNFFSTGDRNPSPFVIYPYNIDEPHVRHCRHGWNIYIEETSLFGKGYSFGYKPSDKFRESGQQIVLKYPVGVRYEDNTLKPAVMTLYVSDTYTTKISCLIEKAYTLKSVQNFTISPGEVNFDYYFDSAIEQKDVNGVNSLCISVDCKSLDPELINADFIASYINLPTDSRGLGGINARPVSIVLYPLKTTSGLVQNPDRSESKDNCKVVENNKENYVHDGGTDPVEAMILCAE